MVMVKSVKIDGADIHVFNSAIYIYESSTGVTLELDLIVSEIVKAKYGEEENLFLEIELEDGRIIDNIMHVKRFSGGLPQLNLYCPLDDIADFHNLPKFNENEHFALNLEEGITIGDIRKVEMPNQKINLKLNLPIDQCEWLNEQSKKDLNKIFQEIIYKYWDSKNEV
ncbi:hypothetical protein [Peribacillus sp. SCS-155]|uniref:hypothetical protein n=1 Tax=Peribacillus sedimenti TaxID=3115297 RepID=UPI003905E54F